MVSLFIILMIVIVLTGLASFAVFSVMKSSETMLLVQRNVARMDMVAMQVRGALESDDDGVYAPMGELTGGYTVAPGWLVTDAATPWGVRYSYCPYRPSSTNKTGDSPEGVTEGSGDSYSVNVADFPDGSGADFVVGGAQHPDSAVRDEDVLVLIVSPVVRSTAVPDCSDVTYDGSAFKVPDGTVVAVRDPGQAALQIGYETVHTTCDSSDGATCTATCTGSKRVIFGECPSSLVAGDMSSLVSFGSNLDKDSFTCEWADPLEAEVTMSLTCAMVR